MLKEKTAEILTTYGSSMTELKPDEWISIHYDVGGGIQLLQGGPDYFLVQARVSDVREAANRSGEAGVQWLLERLVTNEKPQEG